MNKNYLLCGVGGQGTVLAAKVLAQAAMNKGLQVKTTETIGMAQRGGSVVSHVRFGYDIHSPLIPKNQADVIIAFEPGEAVRNLGYLKENGVVVVSTKAIYPVTATIGAMPYDGNAMIDTLKQRVKKLILVDGEAIVRHCQTEKVLNVALLGAAVQKGALDFSREEVLNALFEKIPETFRKINEEAFECGERECFR